MASNEKDFIQKLITQSKNLAEANVQKCKLERVFRELTLFQNLSNFCKLEKPHGEHSSSDNIGLEKVLKVNFKVYPSPLRLDPVRANETLTLDLCNVSKTFSFNCHHWQFILDLNNREEVSSWSLENNLDPGSSESFSTSFYTSHNISPIQVQLRALFSISHLDRTFTKSLLVYKTSLDILHLLTPSRYPRTVLTGSLAALDPVQPFYTNSNPTPGGSRSSKNNSRTQSRNPRTQTYPEDDDDEEEELPSVTQFFIKLCPNLIKQFVRQVLLKDCHSRWLLMKSESEISTLVKNSPTFSMYYLEDEVVVSRKPSSGMIAFKCTNPKVLGALKVGILRRLLLIQSVTVTHPNDSICEKLYALRLRLEEISRQQMQASSVQIKDFVDIYLDLRDISETIEFSSDDLGLKSDDVNEVVVID